MEFATTKLFGGHVTVELPKDWIDASTHQPVPNNQEAFLTPTGQFDARLIFEITEYITPRDGEQAHEPDLNDDSLLQPGSLDLAALKYYVDDLLSITDDDWTSTNPPQPIDLGSPSMKPCSVYYLQAQLKARSSTTVNAHGELPRASPESLSWLHLLFVRVPQHGSEFVVQMIVKNGAQNSIIAKQVMLKIAETLEFKSFDALVG